MLFLFKVVEDTDHGTPTHNVNNSFNNAHNSYFLCSMCIIIGIFEQKFNKKSHIPYI